jgi:phosphoribosylamine--glycine ligase
MKILIIGSGGREHALGWKISQSKKVSEIYFAPGNAGTLEIGTNINAKSTTEIITWLKKNKVGLVVVGPDDYLAEGIVDKIQKLKIPVFGPTKQASKIEWSKSFAKKLMIKNNIPTAKYKEFTNYKLALKYLSENTFPQVIKADGLANGKGVSVVKSLEEGRKELSKIMLDKKFGSSGNKVIIEEFLEGFEISTHAFCDGKNIKMFPTSKDHKRLLDKDKGPNTGGMGTIAPVPGISKKHLDEIERRVVLPIIKALSDNNSKFVGVLYPGIMLTKNGLKVIEFNARFGDPETESYMMLLNTDLVEIMLSCIKGKLDKQTISWKSGSASTVILATKEYPEKQKVKQEIIVSKKLPKNTEVFHCGTEMKGGKVYTSGGRILGITNFSKTLKGSLSNNYKNIKNIKFEGMQYRKDIGKK